jgi:predicted PurR-regulated permease PerM
MQSPTRGTRDRERNEGRSSPGSKESLTWSKARIGVLFILAVGISLVFVRIIWNFMLALLLAAVLAGLAQPVYRRLVRGFRGRLNLASATTVALSLAVVVIPIALFMGVLVDQSLKTSKVAGEWVKQYWEQPANIDREIQSIPVLRDLLPYQDEIVEKAGQLAHKAGSFVAQQVASGARGTAEYFLTLFVMLYAMFTFLIHGQTLLDAGFRFVPLSEEDKSRLLQTFTSVTRASLYGTVAIGIVQGGLAGASFAVAGIEGALFWGTVMAVLSIIPGVGTALVWVPAVIFLALNGQTGAAVGIALWCVLVVGTVDNVLRPMLVGKETEMPDLLIMLTTMGGLAVFGAVGIIIGPIVGALFMTIWTLWDAAVEQSGLALTGSEREGDTHGK